MQIPIELGKMPLHKLKRTHPELHRKIVNFKKKIVKSQIQYIGTKNKIENISHIVKICKKLQKQKKQESLQDILTQSQEIIKAISATIEFRREGGTSKHTKTGTTGRHKAAAGLGVEVERLVREREEKERTQKIDLITTKAKNAVAKEREGKHREAAELYLECANITRETIVENAAEMETYYLRSARDNYMQVEGTKREVSLVLRIAECERRLGNFDNATEVYKTALTLSQGPQRLSISIEVCECENRSGKGPNRESFEQVEREIEQSNLAARDIRNRIFRLISDVFKEAVDRDENGESISEYIKINEKIASQIELVENTRAEMNRILTNRIKRDVHEHKYEIACRRSIVATEIPAEEELQRNRIKAGIRLAMRAGAHTDELVVSGIIKLIKIDIDEKTIEKNDQLVKDIGELLGRQRIDRVLQYGEKIAETDVAAAINFRIAALGVFDGYEPSAKMLFNVSQTIGTDPLKAQAQVAKDYADWYLQTLKNAEHEIRLTIIKPLLRRLGIEKTFKTPKLEAHDTLKRAIEDGVVGEPLGRAEFREGQEPLVILKKELGVAQRFQIMTHELFHVLAQQISNGRAYSKKQSYVLEGRYREYRKWFEEGLTEWSTKLQMNDLEQPYIAGGYSGEVKLIESIMDIVNDREVIERAFLTRDLDPLKAAFNRALGKTPDDDGFDRFIEAKDRIRAAETLVELIRGR
ncbi:hypothetical protein HY990_03800 [Candidatus Micrarchaeota archaeon]|nr:hypothetical protein [Candidatus Micrarchaeota archaeon]